MPRGSRTLSITCIRTQDLAELQRLLVVLRPVPVVLVRISQHWTRRLETVLRLERVGRGQTGETLQVGLADQPGAVARVQKRFDECGVVPSPPTVDGQPRRRRLAASGWPQ